MNVDLEACEEDQDTLKGKYDWKGMQIRNLKKVKKNSFQTSEKGMQIRNL